MREIKGPSFHHGSVTASLFHRIDCFFEYDLDVLDRKSVV